MEIFNGNNPRSHYLFQIFGEDLIGMSCKLMVDRGAPWEDACLCTQQLPTLDTFQSEDKITDNTFLTG